MTNSERDVYVVGCNQEGEFGLGHSQNVRRLTKCPHKAIARIFSGFSQTVYINENGTKVWTAGYNFVGQCGVNKKQDRNIKTLTQIKYFEKNQIKINQVFMNTIGYVCFFVSDDKKLYASGWNEKYQMGWNEEEIKLYQSDGKKPQNQYT